MNRFVFILMVLLLVTSAVLLTSCEVDSGQVDNDRPPSDQPPGEREYDLDGTGRAVAESLGDNAVAAYAIMKASDNGYSPYQIARAIDEGLLVESGEIEGVTPARPGGNVLSDRDGEVRSRFASHAGSTAAPAVFARAADGPTSLSDFEQMFEEIRGADQAGRWLVWLLGATGAGYSVEEITDYLGRNTPLADFEPPMAFGVPVIVDDDGVLVTPELPADWPYKGRNILSGLAGNPDLTFDDNFTVLVIGMVNAGYSISQINEAVTINSIGMCATAGGSAETDAARLTPCYVQGGSITPPDEATKWSPARILTENVIPEWPISITSAIPPNKSGDLESGSKVSLKLIPTLPSPDTTKAIKSYEIIIEVDPSPERGYEVTGYYMIELIQEFTEDHVGGNDKGERWVIEGEIFSDEPVVLLSNLDQPTLHTVTHYSPDGKVTYTLTDEYKQGFKGSLDDDLEGDGLLNNSIIRINWETE
ncbi:MAG: hypothetical protein IBX61_04210 [Thermoleophilia bacterium]|nr:hypothetical protein [Thermoleophilia bacterium]